MPVSVGSIRRDDPRVLLARFWLDVEAARRALARGRPSAVALAARGLLSSLCNVRVRVEMAHAAAAFAEGEEERPAAEEWVFFAIAARATLDQTVKSGASVLARDLEELDATFDDSREAVLLLEPEDYKEALASAPPDLNAWWGERARLDAGLKEIALERALGALAEE